MLAHFQANKRSKVVTAVLLVLLAAALPLLLTGFLIKPAFAATVTQPILVDTPSGGSAFTYTVSGCSVSPTSGSSGVGTAFTATPSCVLTVTMPTAGTSTRYVFTSSASSTTVTTCSSGTCTKFHPADYYQTLYTLSYSVPGGGSSIVPTLTSTQAGSSYAPTLSTSATAYWLDYGASWSVTPNPLTGSSSTERWDSSQTLTGTVGSTLTTVFAFYNQYSFTLSYSVSGGGSPTAPTLTSTEFGNSYTPTLTGSAAAYWLDYGTGSTSWSVTNPLGTSSSTERWYTSQTVLGTVSAAVTTAYVYNNQFAATFAQSGLDSSATGTVVTVNSTPETYSNLPYAVWVNSGSSVTFAWTNPVTSSTSGEQFTFSSSSQTSPYSVSGATTITGTYATQYEVTFVASPPSDGTTSPSGTNIWENAGPIGITATPGTYWSFDSWSASTGSITIASATSESTTATIGGTGTITADFSVTTSLSAGDIWVSPTEIDSGQSATLSVTTQVSGGVPPYTCEWLVAPPGSGTFSGLASSVCGSSVLTGALSTGTWYFELQVTDYTGVIETSDAVSVMVNPLPTVAVSASPSTIDSGQTSTLTAKPSGGTGFYGYAWSLPTGVTSPPGCGTSDSTCTVTSTTPGSYTVSVTVTDAVGGTASSSSSLTVNPAPETTSLTSPVTIDPGQTYEYSTTASGGTGSFSYAWSLPTGVTSPPGCGTSDSTCTVTSTTPGSYTVSVTVTDAVGGTASSSSSLTVNPALAVSVTPVTIDSGESTTLTAIPSGGSGDYTAYAWYPDICVGTPLPSGTSASYPTGELTTNTNYCVMLTDSLGGTAEAYPTVTVSGTPSVSVSVSLTAIDSGQSATLSVTTQVSGGVPPYTCEWLVAPPGSGTFSGLASSVCGSSVLTGALSTGTWYFELQVTDSTGFTAKSDAVSVMVNPLPTVAVSASPSTIDSGQTSTLTAKPSGGTGPYTYGWAIPSGVSTASGCTSSGSTCTVTSTTPSHYSLGVKVIDSTGASSSSSVSLTVNSALSISVSPVTIDSGQTATQTAVASGGSGSYTIAWYSGTSCAGTALQSGALKTYKTAALTVTTTYCVEVTDSLAGTVTNTVIVTVNRVLSVSVSPVTIDNGQTTTLAAVASGGSTSYTTYAWYPGTAYVWHSGFICIGALLQAGASASYTTAALTSTTEYCVRVTDSLGGTATTPVVVTVNPVLSTTTMSGGGATVNQTSTTGTSVTITGSTAPDGTKVTVNSQNWGTTQPPGTGSVSLNSMNFFDIRIKGISYGSAQVCINNLAVTSATVMQYWNGTQWVGAASQTVTVETICGEIPVSALQGTPIVLGTLTTATGGSVVTVSCVHAFVTVGTVSTCKAIVSGSRPTGTVAWSSSSSGKFSKLTCKLSKGACSVRFTPNTAGSSVVLTAIYGGDSKNSPSAGTYILTVVMKAAKLKVSCTPRSAVAGSSTTVITCMARVTGYGPTGTVTWSQSGTGSVSLSATTCTLTKGKCSVTMTGSISGQVVITATYAGDSDNQGSSGTTKLTIKAPPFSATVSYASNPISRDSNQTITVTVTNSHGPVVSVSVDIHVTYASGSTTKDYVCTTGKDGSCSYSWPIGGNSTPGTFPVVVTVEGIQFPPFSFQVTTA